MQKSNQTNVDSLAPITLAQAIFTVNRHAKTATNNKYLYKLKHQSILKMLQEGKAEKKGLHFSNNPRFSKQQSDVLVQCNGFTFHIPPTKEDFQTLPHLGKLNSSIRNPRVQMSLTSAKKVLQAYTGLYEKNSVDTPKKPSVYEKPIFKKLGESYGSIPRRRGSYFARTEK